MKYRISEKAFEDIKNIWLYTVETWSAAEQADRYYNLIFDEIEHLAGHPAAGRCYDHIRKGYRCARVKSHLIFYRLGNPDEIIEIIRVLHQSMNTEERLNE